MKSIFVIFLSICTLLTGCLGTSPNEPIEVTRQYFEFSRTKNFEESSKLWNNTQPIKPGESVVRSSPEAKEKFRFDLSYSNEIFDTQYEIANYKEFPKSEDSTVLCLSLKTKSDLKRVFRVELSLIDKKWKITRMKNANEDALAVIHNDCSTVQF